MGKKPKKHRAKQPAQEVTVQGPHRRDVLKWMWVGTSALGVLAYTGYNLFSSSNKWAFLEIDPEVYCRTYWTEIVKDGVALLPEFAEIEAVGVPLTLLRNANLAAVVEVPPMSKSTVELFG